MHTIIWTQFIRELNFILIYKYKKDGLFQHVETAHL
jgi:hypothetical protein